jgi:outer membrane receptor protein involved in Fe transport
MSESSLPPYRPRPCHISPGPEALWTLALVMSLVLAPAPAWAQEEAAAAAPTAAPSGVEVIRVTGRPMAAIETEVPESVTQFDTAALEALGAQDVSDLAKVSPNVEIRVAGATAPTFFIRGVGLSDFNANAAGAVSVYQDEVAINAPAIQIGQLFDVANIEVLRGPQGGGSGRNASAGAIKISSRKPTGEMAANMNMSLGRYESNLARHALIQDYEGAVEIPLVEEMLATRLAFRLAGHDPYATNSCGNAPPVEDRPRVGDPNPDPPPPRLRASDVALCGEGQAGPNRIRFGEASPIAEGLPSAVTDSGSWAARGQLRFQPPGTEMDWLLNLHGSRLDQLSTLGQAMGTGYGDPGQLGTTTIERYVEPDNAEMRAAIWEQVREQYPDLPRPEQTELVQETLENELARNLDIDPYRGDYNRVGSTTLDAWGGFVRGDASIGSINFTTISAYDTYERFREMDQDFTPDVIFEEISMDEAWQFSQELRLSGELADTPLRWNVGGYYLMEQLSADIESFLQLESQSPTRVYEQNLWSFAFYTGFSWDFLDDFTLEGGVRYNWERKDFDFTISSPIKGTRRSVDSSTWQAPTGTLSLTYRFMEDASAYWKYSRGWKGGHYNASALFEALEQGMEPVEPETIDAFEAGMRGRFLDGRLGLGLALFYYKYVDYQVFVVEDDLGAPPSYVIVNANDAEVYGAELDLRAEPLAGWLPPTFDGLVLTGRLGWLETQFLDFTNEVYRSRLVPGEGPVPAELNLPIVVDYSGNRLINSPRLKASLAAEWTFDLGRWGALIPRYDFAWTDDIFFDPSEGRGSPDQDGNLLLPEYTVGQRAFWLHNARLAYRTPSGNIEIACFVRNLTDQVYKNFAFDASTFGRTVINMLGEPRSWGFSVSVNW